MVMTKMSNERYNISARQFAKFGAYPAAQVRAALDSNQWKPLLDQLGIGIDQVISAFAADAAISAPLTTASITNPVQFLQTWLPGFIEVITAARKIDALVGITMQGDWHGEEVVQGIMEYLGNSQPYGDYTNVPLSSWNVNWERRTIVRFEEGLQVGRLDEARAATIRVDSAQSKRTAAAVALEIRRNSVGFYGYNSGANRTYGFLNDPNLPAYSNVAAGVGGTGWNVKTFNEIVADILEALRALRTGSKDVIDISTAPICLAVSTNRVDYLATVNSLGTISVREWLRQTYPSVRVESAPELDSANGGANVFYLYADTVPDSGSDDQRTFVQVVPAKFQTLGVQQLVKGYEEGYTNASAGVMLKRPYAVVRRSAI